MSELAHNCSSSKMAAFERLEQLDEQISALESSARVIEGGFKNTNKVFTH